MLEFDPTPSALLELGAPERKKKARVLSTVTGVGLMMFPKLLKKMLERVPRWSEMSSRVCRVGLSGFVSPINRCVCLVSSGF